MTDIEDIQVFVEVINSAGFGKAARRLGVSKSLVSRRVARLEKDLGVRLLNRNTRGFGLTEAGIEFGERGARILSDLSAAHDAVRIPRGEIAGQLRVSVPQSFGVRYMGRMFAKLLSLHPRLELDISYDDRVCDLLSKRFDVAVRVGILSDSTLIARHIAHCSLVVVASPEYLARHAAPVHPVDLGAHECLIYTGAAQLQTWQFRLGKRRLVFSPRGRFQADNGEALIEAAEAGLGIAALPDFIVRHSLEAGRLVAVLSDYSLQPGAIYVVRPAGALVPAKTRAFTDLMVQTFGQLPASGQHA